LSKKTFEAAAAHGAHLVVQLKENQMKLHQRVTHACRCATPLSCAQTVDVGRNRHETRTLAVFDARTSVVGTEWESYVACILRMERFTPIYNTKMRQWDARHEISFYLSNRSIDADKAIVVVRDHWGIENKFHYVRDVTMLEDTSRMRVKPGIFARFRSFAFNILRLNQRDTIAQDRYECALGGIPFLSKLIM
jgi:predicted transposase YbfD/YdcC